MRNKYVSQILNVNPNKLGALLVIIPAYNEASNLVETVNNLLSIAHFNFLIVDDCSTDETESLCIRKNWNYIKNENNVGLSESFRNGVKYALENGFTAVVQYDGDGQHNANDIIPMLVFIEKGYDVVITSRYNNYEKNEVDYRKLLAHKILRGLFLLKTHQKISDPTCGLRMFNKFVMMEYASNKKLEVEPSTIAYLISYKKVKIKQLETIIYNRKYGESTFNSPKVIAKYMIREIYKLLFLFLLRN